MEDFPIIAISLPLPTSRHSLEKFIGMVLFASSIHCIPLTVFSRWNPVMPLGRSLFLSNMIGNKLTSLSLQGVPHLSTIDDLYNDYHIPANSIMVPNQWYSNGNVPPINIELIIKTYVISQTLFRRAMLNDERVYPEPHEFRPERFLKNGKLDHSIRDPMDIAFGFGRR